MVAGTAGATAEMAKTMVMAGDGSRRWQWYCKNGNTHGNRHPSAITHINLQPHATIDHPPQLMQLYTH
eukprot:6812908-Lingulodinium_polyedra.AAC.1